MIKKYRVQAGMDFTLVLAIDTDIMSHELAHEINDFWGGADEILDVSDDDPHQAVARRAAYPLWETLLDGYNEEWALKTLGESEGWPANHGITIIDYELPDFDQSNLDVEQLA